MKLVRKEFIMTDPPVPECHASTIVKLGAEEEAAAWFAGTKEGEKDVMIWFSRRENGVWTAPRRIPSAEGIPHWNPVLFAMEGRLRLFYKIGYTIPDWKTMYTDSFDGGATWSEERELVLGDKSGGRGPVKNKPIRLSGGTILAPGSTERGEWKCFADIFRGDGWSKREIPSEKGVGLIQPSFWESAPGQVHGLMRSDCGRIYRTDSSDGGESWCMAYPTPLPNNNSGLDCVMTESGTLVLVCNPVGENWGPRTPLTVFLSADNGKTFQKALDLESGEGGFAYPAVIACGDRVYVTYTWNRKNIVCCELKI